MGVDLFLTKLNERIIKYDVDALYHHNSYVSIGENLDGVLIISKEKRIFARERKLFLYEYEIKEHTNLDVFVDYIFNLLFPSHQNLRLL